MAPWDKKVLDGLVSEGVGEGDRYGARCPSARLNDAR